MLSDFHGRHNGQKCYIFGCGPSLLRYDCDKLVADGISISCNASIMALSRCDYFLFTDARISDDKLYFSSVFEKAREIILGNIALIPCCSRHAQCDILLTDCPVVVHPQQQGAVPVAVPSSRRRAVDDGFDFSLDVDRLIAGGAIEVAAHLAHVMGCAPIILVGVDLSWLDGQKYFQDRSDRELWPWVNEDNTEENDKSLRESYDYWRRIKAQNPDLQVFVANEYSKLCDLFPPADLSEFHKRKTPRD